MKEIDRIARRRGVGGVSGTARRARRSIGPVGTFRRSGGSLRLGAFVYAGSGSERRFLEKRSRELRARQRRKGCNERRQAARRRAQRARQRGGILRREGARRRTPEPAVNWPATKTLDADFDPDVDGFESFVLNTAASARGCPDSSDTRRRQIVKRATCCFRRGIRSLRRCARPASQARTLQVKVAQRCVRPRVSLDRNRQTRIYGAQGRQSRVYVRRAE